MPTPEQTPTPTPPPGAVPSTPEPTPTPTPEATPDAVAFLIAHRDVWPKEVTLLVPERFEVVANGVRSGTVEAKPGTTLNVTGLEPGFVTVLFVTASKRLPITSTDLAARAPAAMQGWLDAARGSFPPTAPPTPAVSGDAAMGTGTRTAGAAKFVHPGLPLTAADLETLKRNLTREPWKTGYEQLVNDGHSKLDYKMRGPFAEVSRNPHSKRNEWMSDMQAVWNLARLWYFTRNEAYAKKAHDILLAWAVTQKSFKGIESNLDLGDFAYRFGGGADILRGTWPGWTQADTEAVKKLFDEVYWPASGASGFAPGPANKGMLSLAAGAAIAVFNDDQAKLDHILYLFRTCAACGLPNTLPSGEIGETGRDQGHAYGQWVSMAFLAEVCWKQGIDVYAEGDNRLLAVDEYYARFNHGVPTPFIPMGTTDALYLQNTSAPWPHGRMGMNILHGAYVLRKGLPAPYLDLRRKELPPEPQDMDGFVFDKSVDPSTAAPLPALPLPTAASVTTGLVNHDIGEASLPGNGAYGDGVWTVKGAGSEIWTHDKDSFHFTSRQVMGNFTIIAKVDSLQDTAPNARAGVMFRDSLNANASKKAWIAITPSKKFEFFISGWSEIRGGANWEKRSRDIPLFPYWVKLQRIGEVISLSTSPDGASWGTAGEARFAGLGEVMHLGLAVCSQSPGKLNSATFTDVRITGGDGKEPPKVPAAPLALYPSPGDKQVPLRWLESFGATSYRVKRSMSSGGPYRSVADDVKGTSYVDNSVSNGETYHYVVSAVNPAGESPDSPADATQPGGH